MKKMLLAGNWKMNTNIFESQVLSEYIAGGILQMPQLDAMVLFCPPFTSIPTVAGVIKDFPILLGAQNCYFEPKGAFTGEISAPMLKQLGVSYVILGHSERRTYFNETDSFINKKVLSVLQYEISPILCIGETLNERQNGETFSVLESQLDGCLESVRNEDFSEVVIAYEPVWAIGTGIAATSEQVQEAHSWIRNYLLEKFGKSAAETILLYGGSLTPKNASEILSLPDVNGGLIGGASIDPEAFLEIINIGHIIISAR